LTLLDPLFKRLVYGIVDQLLYSLFVGIAQPLLD